MNTWPNRRGALKLKRSGRDELLFNWRRDALDSGVEYNHNMNAQEALARTVSTVPGYTLLIPGERLDAFQLLIRGKGTTLKYAIGADDTYARYILSPTTQSPHQLTFRDMRSLIRYCVKDASKLSDGKEDYDMIRELECHETQSADQIEICDKLEDLKLRSDPRCEVIDRRTDLRGPPVVHRDLKHRTRNTDTVILRLASDNPPVVHRSGAVQPTDFRGPPFDRDLKPRKCNKDTVFSRSASNNPPVVHRNLKLNNDTRTLFAEATPRPLPVRNTSSSEKDPVRFGEGYASLAAYYNYGKNVDRQSEVNQDPVKRNRLQDGAPVECGIRQIRYWTPKAKGCVNDREPYE